MTMMLVDSSRFLDPIAAGEVRLSAGDHELLRCLPDGTVYVRGEKVDDNVKIYEAIKGWLAGASGARVLKLEKALQTIRNACAEDVILHAVIDEALSFAPEPPPTLPEIEDPDEHAG
jgi:hypothetical protein